jgi:hypothetical protein
MKRSKSSPDQWVVELAQVIVPAVRQYLASKPAVELDGLNKRQAALAELLRAYDRLDLTAIDALMPKVMSGHGPTCRELLESPIILDVLRERLADPDQPASNATPRGPAG